MPFLEIRMRVKVSAKHAHLRLRGRRRRAEQQPKSHNHRTHSSYPRVVDSAIDAALATDADTTDDVSSEPIRGQARGRACQRRGWGERRNTTALPVRTGQNGVDAARLKMARCASSNYSVFGGDDVPCNRSVRRSQGEQSHSVRVSHPRFVRSHFEPAGPFPCGCACGCARAGRWSDATAGAGGIIFIGRIMSLSSWSRMWQCHT